MRQSVKSYHLLLLLVGLVGACNLAQPAPTPTPDLPTVEFLFPENNSRVEHGAELTVDLIARDQSQGIARVEFFVDDVSINQATPEAAVTVPEFRVEMNWLAEGVGLHTLKAVAYRLDGTPSDEAVIVIEVVPPLT